MHDVIIERNRNIFMWKTYGKTWIIKDLLEGLKHTHIVIRLYDNLHLLKKEANRWRSMVGYMRTLASILLDYPNEALLDQHTMVVLPSL